ncbi:MAG: DNA-3-methyladenine glycosylase I [Granulosicoccus sp.]
MSDTSEKRCQWCLASDVYRDYHDAEWGVPCRDSKQLFELINLEGAQAGLSWITILNKRDAYRKLFLGFDPVKVARLTDSRLEKIAADPSIVRHLGKVMAVRGNAQAWLAMQKAGEDFSEFVWSFVDGNVVQNQFSSMGDVPSSTDASLAMCKALKKRGFKFVGATICYAFMQAAGLVNDHLTSCPRHSDLSS